MTCHRNYLSEAYDIAESKTGELGMKWLPGAAHIRALVEVINSQNRILEGMGDVLEEVGKQVKDTLKECRPVKKVYSEDELKVGLTD